MILLRYEHSPRNRGRHSLSIWTFLYGHLTCLCRQLSNPNGDIIKFKDEFSIWFSTIGKYIKLRREKKSLPIFDIWSKVMADLLWLRFVSYTTKHWWAKSVSFFFHVRIVMRTVHSIHHLYIWSAMLDSCPEWLCFYINSKRIVSCFKGW